jgi:hypothetical protein
MFKDLHNILFAIQVFLLIFGYASYTLLGSGSVEIISIIRLLFCILSIAYLVMVFWLKKGNFLILFLIFIWFILVVSVSIFSTDIQKSYIEIAKIFIFLFYFALYTAYVVDKYGKIQTLTFYKKLFLAIYIIPVLSFYLLAFKLPSSILVIGGENGLYGHIIGLFLSNQLGWSSVFSLALVLDLLIDERNKKYQLLYRVLIVLCIYAGLISMARVVFLVWIIILGWYFFIRKETNFKYRILLASMMGAGFTIVVILIPSKMLDLALIQVRLSEDSHVYTAESPRKESARLAYKVFNSDIRYQLTGLGIKNIKQHCNKVNIEQARNGLHNSYLEILFGTGIISSLFFFSIFITWSLFKYLLYYIRRYISFLIPFILAGTENNFGSGQFMFIPFFMFIFFLIQDESIKRSSRRGAKFG